MRAEEQEGTFARFEKRSANSDMITLAFSAVAIALQSIRARRVEKPLRAQCRWPHACVRERCCALVSRPHDFAEVSRFQRSSASMLLDSSEVGTVWVPSPLRMNREKDLVNTGCAVSFLVCSAESSILDLAAY